MKNSLFYASFSRRLLAVFIDTMILLIPCMAANWLVPFVGSFLILLFYTPVLESSELQATFGKNCMGIQVVSVEGSQISFKTACIRLVCKLFSYAIFCIGHFLALFTEKKQTLHDLLADTVVVYGRTEAPLFDTWLHSIKRIFKGANFKSDHTLSQLERIQKLREQGALTEEEFEAQKKKILEG